MSLARSMTRRLPQLRTVRNTRQTSLAQPWQRAGRRGYASAQETAQNAKEQAKKGLAGDLPWALVATAVTVPSTYFILANGTDGKDAGYPGDHYHAPDDEEHEEGEEEGGDDGDEENAEGDEKGDEEKEGGDEGEEKSEGGEESEAKAESGKEESNDKPKEESKDDSKEESKDESKEQPKEESKEESKDEKAGDSKESEKEEKS